MSRVICHVMKFLCAGEGGEEEGMVACEGAGTAAGGEEEGAGGGVWRGRERTSEEERGV